MSAGSTDGTLQLFVAVSPSICTVAVHVVPDRLIWWRSSKRVEKFPFLAVSENTHPMRSRLIGSVQIYYKNAYFISEYLVAGKHAEVIVDLEFSQHSVYSTCVHDEKSNNI